MPPPFEEWWRGIKCYPCPCVRASVRASDGPLSKFGVRSITLERLHRFNSNLVCLYIISKHRSSSIWVTIHYFFTELWAFYKNIKRGHPCPMDTFLVITCLFAENKYVLFCLTQLSKHFLNKL